jgi:hypothetical protein
MLPVSRSGEFGDISKGRFLQSSRQSLASCRGKHLGKVTVVVVVVVALMDGSPYEDAARPNWPRGASVDN